MKYRMVAALCLCCAFSRAQEIEPRGFHARIDTLILAKKFDEAEALALKAVKEYPREPAVLCALGCVYRNKARKSTLNVDLGGMGIKEGETGTTEVPLDSASLEKYFHENVDYDREEYRKAEEVYNRIITIAPQYENAYYNLLNDYQEMHRFDGYFPVVEKFIANIADTVLKKNALLDLASKLAVDPATDSKVAIRMYETILKAFPHFTYAESDLGAMYFKQGMVEKAIPMFRGAYEADPHDRITLANYVHALVYQERFDEAYRVSHALAPMDTLSYFLTGLLGRLAGNPYRNSFSTLARIRKATVRDTAGDFWFKSSEGFLSLDSMKKEEKLEFLEFLIDNFNRAEMHAEAIAAANIERNIEPTNFSLLVLGSIYDRNTNLEKTLKYLDLIAERRKKDSTIISEYALLSNYARIYLVKDKFEKAQTYLLLTRGMKEKDARLNYYLGLCALGLGDKQRAIRCFKENEEMNEKSQMEWINRSIWKLRTMEANKGD